MQSVALVWQVLGPQWAREPCDTEASLEIDIGGTSNKPRMR